MTAFWAKAEKLLIVVVMVGSSYTELLANAAFHVFLSVQIWWAAGVLWAFCSRKGDSHGRESPHNKNSGSFYGWRAVKISIRSSWQCYRLDQFLTLALNTLILSIFYISLDLSTIYFAHFSECWASFVCNCHSILECCIMFPGVKLSMGSFVLFHTVLVACYDPACLYWDEFDITG